MIKKKVDESASSNALEKSHQKKSTPGEVVANNTKVLWEFRACPNNQKELEWQA